MLSQINDVTGVTKEAVNLQKSIKYKVDFALYCLALYLICLFIISPLANRFKQYFATESKTVEIKNKPENANQKSINPETANSALQNQSVKTK